jgi:hypothetical protein
VAQFGGYISGASATSGGTATLNLSTAISGAATVASMPGGTVIAGPGIAGCPLSCPTLTTPSSGLITFGSGINSANVGSSGSPITMAAGAWKPALPTASNSFNGYISGSTLNVTSIGTGSGYASFTGSLYTSFTASISTAGVLTVSSPTSGGSVIGVGTTITGAGVPTGEVVTSLGTGVGINGTYNVSPAPGSAVASEAMYGGGTLAGQATTLIVSGVTGTISGGMVVTDGGASLTGPPLLLTGGSCTVCAIAPTYYPAIANDTTMVGTLTTLIPGQYVAATGIATPVKILSYQGACGVSGAYNGGPGCYTLSNSANGSIGSSGSPVALTSTSISDGGAIAPGPALTIHDLGPGVTFPVTSYGSGSFGSYSSGTGSLRLSGTFDTSVLGGAPSTIQAQVSTTAGGPPISGCAACAWTALSGYSATLSSGTVFNWCGQALSIPAGGPYYVSVRAANGTAYATMPNLIKVGLIFNFWGEGQLGSIIGGLGGTGLSYVNFLWGLVQPSGLDTGPPVIGNYAPAQTNMVAGDRFGVTGASAPPLAEGIGNFEQGLANAFGWPAGIINGERDGTGTGPQTQGNIVQTQTVGVGNASAATWCSATIFCSNASVSGPLFFNVASMTGASLLNATISGSSLTVPAGSGQPTTTGLMSGALEPGLILNVAGSPTLTTCLTGCTASAYGNPPGAQSWALSASASGTPTRADPAGGAPWPAYNSQISGVSYGLTGFGVPLIQAGTFQIIVNGTVVCHDTQTFAYNNQGGNCTGAGISSSFVNYLTGDYSVTFSTPPANNAVITASWTNILSPEGNASGSFSRPIGIDYFGNGSCTSGFMSSLFCKTPGGVSGNFFAGSDQDAAVLIEGGYTTGAVGYTQYISWLYGVKFPTLLPGVSASTPFIAAGYWRTSGPVFFDSAVGGADGAANFLVSEWYHDVATKSTFSGTIASGVLTLSSAASGPMWEGEIIGGAGLPVGIDIIGLTGGSWGASGSTYALGGASGLSFTGAMQNAVYYQGSGPAIYAGPMNDNVTQSGSAGPGSTPPTGSGPHPGNGFAGGRRVGSRWAALVWGGLTTPANASDPTLDRAKADAGGCDTAAIAAPCLDVGTTYSRTYTPTSVSGKVLTFNGLSAHALPIVVGQSVTCSGCSGALFVSSVSNPPTQSTVAGAGQIGSANNGFTVTLAGGGTLPGGTPAYTFGCSGVSGTGSNCVDVAITINTTNGTWGHGCSSRDLRGEQPQRRRVQLQCAGRNLPGQRNRLARA